MGWRCRRRGVWCAWCGRWSHRRRGRCTAGGGVVVPVRPRRGPIFGIWPRNLQQPSARDLLLDGTVRLVSLIGSAGTGRTLLAVAAGMSKVLNDQVYQKLLV